MAYEYVKQFYGVNPEPGMRVKMGDKLGTVARKKHYDHYVHVKFDDRKFDVPVHPMELEYDISELAGSEEGGGPKWRLGK